MTQNDHNKGGSHERLEQLKTVRTQVKRALEEVEERPKSEHTQETINRLREQLEKINNDLIKEQRALGNDAKGDLDLEMMDIMLETQNKDNEEKK